MTWKRHCLVSDDRREERVYFMQLLSGRKNFSSG